MIHLLKQDSGRSLKKGNREVTYRMFEGFHNEQKLEHRFR